MSGTGLVVDASVVVAALVNDDDLGDWCLGILTRSSLIAPDIILIEVTNVLRRLVRHQHIPLEEGSMALQSLADLPMQTVPASMLLGDIWQRRDNFTAYDAAYLTTAANLELPFATLDKKMASQTTPCELLLPGF